MKEDTWCKIHKIKQIILSKKGILKNRLSLSVATIFSTLCIIFLMTGALYFRNTVIIHDNGKILHTFTMEETAEGILKEQKIELSDLDYYLFKGIKNSKGELHIMRAIDLSVADGENKVTAQAKQLDSVAQVATALGFNLSAYDSANYPLDYQCMGGEEIIINRAFDVKVIYNGDTKIFKASNNTVKDLLNREGILTSKHDIVFPSPDTPIHNGIEIKVTRVDYKKTSTIEEIPYKTIERSSNLAVIGHREVISKGVAGKIKVIANEKLVDGKVVSRNVLEKTRLLKPKSEIVSTGKALAVPYSKREFEEIILENGRPKNYEYIISGKSCAYTAGPRAGTASGRKLEIGTVAVNPNVIPYGSLLYIVTQDGRHVYGAAVAADTGLFVTITDDVVVDLYMGLTSENYDKALQWGAKYVDIYVINTGKY